MKTYTQDEIARALNEAADTVLDYIDSDEAKTDTVNLVVNVAMHYLTVNPDADLAEVVEANYDLSFIETDDSPLDTVTGWCNA